MEDRLPYSQDLTSCCFLQIVFLFMSRSHGFYRSGTWDVNFEGLH